MTDGRKLHLLPHQDEFAFSNAAYPALGGGWGNGKTLAGCLAAYLRCEESPDNLFFIGRKRFSDLRDSTLADFMDWFGDRVRFLKSEMAAELPNGSKILFRHLENAQLSNLNLGGFWIDQAEEVSEKVFIDLVGRLRRKVKRRQGFVTFNMQGHNWIWRRFRNLLGADDLPLDSKDHHLVEATTLTNRENLPADYIVRLLKLPPNVRNRYVYGSWDEFEGRIWPQFQEHSHVIDPFTPPSGWEVFEMGDHGYSNPTAWYWGAVDYDGNVYVFDEHYLPGATVATHAKAMKAIRVKHGIEPKELTYSVIDPSTRNREGITGLSIIAEYQDNGIDLVPGNNDVLAGINRVAEYLTVDPERIHPITRRKGSPKLFVTRNCVHAIEEWQDYQWQVLNVRSIELNQPEHPRKYKDHACDALRYGIMSRPDTPERTRQAKPGSEEALKQRYLEVIRAEQEEQDAFQID